MSIQKAYFHQVDPDPWRSQGQVRVIEKDTTTCQHCGKVVFLPANGKLDNVGDMCRTCWEFICAECVGKNGYRCDRLEEKLAREEAKYQARRSYEQG